MMVKSGLEKIILKFHSGRLTCQANSVLLDRFFCTGQQELWRPSWNFKIIFSRPLFTIIFKPKMVSNLRKNFLGIVWHQKPTVRILWGIEDDRLIRDSSSREMAFQNPDSDSLDNLLCTLVAFLWYLVYQASFRFPKICISRNPTFH